MSVPGLVRIPSDEEHEASTSFRGTLPPVVGSLEVVNGDEESDFFADTPLFFGCKCEGKILEEIPFEKCCPGIMEVLEKFKIPTEPERAIAIHRKLVAFIDAICNSELLSDAQVDCILYALENGPFLADIIISNGSYMNKFLAIFEEDWEIHSVIVNNIFSFLSKLLQIVLAERDKIRNTQDLEIEWDAADAAVDYLLMFTQNSSSMTWFLKHLDNVQISNFLLTLIVEFYSRAEFSAIIANWLHDTNLIEELVALFQDPASPHFNVSAILEGLVDVCGAHRRNRKPNLANQLFNFPLISQMQTSSMALLKAVPSDARDDGVVLGFRIFSRILRLDNTKPSARRSEYRQRGIDLITNNAAFLEAVDKVLQLGGPKTYIKLSSKGVTPLGRVRRALLSFVHDVVVSAGNSALQSILKVPTLEYFIKYLFWLQPFSSFVHLKIRSIIIVLLKCDLPEAADMLVLRSNFLEGAMEFLKKPNPPGLQRAHIMRIISVWVNYRHTTTNKEAMEKWMAMNPCLQSEWEQLVFHDLQAYLRKQGVLLGGVPKPRKNAS